MSLQHSLISFDNETRLDFKNGDNSKLFMCDSSLFLFPFIFEQISYQDLVKE